MKKLTVISLVSALTVIGGNSMAASAVDGMYLKAFGGVAMGKASGLNSLKTSKVSISSGIETTDKSAVFGGALGYSIPNMPLSLELQAQHINSQSYKMAILFPTHVPLYHEYANLNVRSNVYLLNAIYSLPAQGCFTPFIGAGLGAAQNKTDGTFVSTTQAGHTGGWRDNSSTNFAYDLTAGVSYKVSDHVNLSLSYQYLNLGKVTSASSNYHNTGSSYARQMLTMDNLANHNVLLGVTYTF